MFANVPLVKRPQKFQPPFSPAEVRRVRARPFERYRSIVRQHLIPQLGNLQLAKHARYRGHGAKAEKYGVLASS